MTNPWNDHYASGDLPWDTGEPCPLLTTSVAAGALPPGRVLEIGCGTGTNAVWLAQQGYEVTGVDLAPLAIERARVRAAQAGVAVSFAVHDILAAAVPGGPFDAVFDRGVFHVFDAPADQSLFAARVAAVLRPGGRWLSIVGSTEGPARGGGPPRRSLRDIADAVEPHLAILQVQGGAFDVVDASAPRAWRVLSELRTEPAQPSTRR